MSPEERAENVVMELNFFGGAGAGRLLHQRVIARGIKEAVEEEAWKWRARILDADSCSPMSEKGEALTRLAAFARSSGPPPSSESGA